MQFSQQVLEKINQVFRFAHNENRKILYEHEVYKVLDCIGLETPEFIFTDNPANLNDNILKRFSHYLVLKIVSPDISHKQKLGGVKKVRNYDPLFVQFVLTQMKKEVLSHFPEHEKPDIKGFLVVEFIPHTQALGYEVLLGFKEDNAFGPVMTLSKGGDDAEFFAQYYDPPNLFLPPLDPEQSMDMVLKLNIRHKFEQKGTFEYLKYFADAASLLSRLACHYSFISEPKPEFIIKAMDINPFVISEDKRFIAVDGFALFSSADQEENSVPPVNMDNLDGFFNPSGIGVIGVSANPEKQSIGRIIAHQLHDMGRDDLYLINSNGGEICFDNKKYPMFCSIDEIQADLDLIVYAAPARFIEDFFKSLNHVSPKAIILIPGIPSDLNYGTFIQKLDCAIPDSLKSGKTRIMGPNCMGVFYGPKGSDKGINTLFIEEERLSLKCSKSANTVLLTQSGAFSVTAIDKFQNSGLLKSIVSFGNKYDVKLTDLTAWFSLNPLIDVIALYVEGLAPGEGRQFFQLSKNISKPIIVYKAGKTSAGAKAAESHTASLSGSYDVFKAGCKQAGIILVENIEDHYNYVKMFSLAAKKLPRGARVAGVVNAGFESAVGADELKHLQQAQLSEHTKKKLIKLNTLGLIDTSTSFLDITPMADDLMYADFVEAVLQDDNVDCVFVSIVPHSSNLKTLPETCHDPDSIASRLVDLSKNYCKPVVISVNAGRYYQDFVSILEKNGFPVYNDIRSAVKSLDCFVSYHTQKKMGQIP
ncbi:putative CoA-binding protein [Desulfonema limicola]|uniref:CoA-binding protein n=1 Tax=Desulfonema limicola TaxID=45656 RepID=A0A975B718_9BACT|nr:acetate--CoA ligase family protein [Desulfonema limicola]QTA80044.1 putative CoA-binding protein [Desulfonema limicola]